jgi:DNA adenine methylase
MTDTQIAARMIYLNKTGFNGLYRVNRSGKFNVPYGQYKNPTICNEELLHEVSKTLQGVELIKQDFEAATENMRMNDAAYFDPPYWPVKEGSFVAYNDNGFDSEDQARLAYVANKLKDKRIAAVFSNSDVPPVRKLYEGLHMAKVEVPRRINSDGTGRGMVSELLITTKRRP